MFLLNHWILTITLLVLLGAIIYVETKGTVRGVKKLSSQELIHMMNREEAMVVDVRDRNAYVSGHIANAVNIPPSEIVDNKKMADLKNNPIILVCANGMTSPGLAAQLVKQGFQKVFYLSGGMGTWRADSLPTVK